MAPIIIESWEFNPDTSVLAVLTISAVAATSFLITLFICSCCGGDTKNVDVDVPQMTNSPKTTEVKMDGEESSPGPALAGSDEAPQSSDRSAEMKKEAAITIDPAKLADQTAAEDDKKPSAAVKVPSDEKVSKSFVPKSPQSKQTNSKAQIPNPTADQVAKSLLKSPTGKKKNHFMGGNCLSTTRNDMNAPVVIPATSKHTATAIFLHGLGDTGHGWAPVFQMMRSPHVKYICPTAPTIPVTLNMGMQMPSWFDIKGLNINADEDEAGIKKATTAVHSWLDEEIKSGIPSDRILLGGFSQGGGLALYSALTYDKPLAGVVGLSCWLPLHKQVPGSHQANKNVPILQCHGDADPLVIVQVGQLTAKMLQGFNSNHTLKIYPGLGHSSCDQEIQDIKQFVEQRLPPK